MNEVFKKTNEFLSQYEENLQIELNKMSQALHDGEPYFFNSSSKKYIVSAST